MICDQINSDLRSRSDLENDLRSNSLIFSHRLTAGTIGSTAAGTGSAHQRQHSDAIVNSTESSASVIPAVDKRFRTTSEGNAHFDIKPRSICKSCKFIISLILDMYIFDLNLKINIIIIISFSYR